MEEPRVTVRLDKWLWHARFTNTRGLAAKLVSSGRVRVNGTRTDKPARAVGPGDVLTFARGKQVSVVRIVAVGERRGPAPEARTLFAEIGPSTNARPEDEGGAC